MKKIKQLHYSLLLLFILSVSSSCNAYSQNIGRWEKLGERTVNLGLNKDVIHCAHKGTFTTIRFHVSRAPVSFKRVFVKYANGSTDNLNFNQLVRPGENSRYLDLRGNRRVIREIIVYYKAEKKNPRHGNRYRKASVQIWGRH